MGTSDSGGHGCVRQRLMDCDKWPPLAGDVEVGGGLASVPGQEFCGRSLSLPLGFCCEPKMKE